MPAESNVAVLLDCENAQPAVIDDVRRAAAKLGRVVLRHGYGNQAALTNKWQEALLRHGFAPHLQFQYVNGKNTADIALALDALEILLDRRADQFVIVTSDSDFVGLCRKLRERGAEVHIFGEGKTPAALRDACDRFQEVATPEPALAGPAVAAPVKATGNVPKFLVKAVRELAQSSPNGMVSLAELGNRLRQIDANFSPSTYGHKKLRTMLEACDQLIVNQSAKTQCHVGLAAGAQQPAALRAV